jgi:hypothetical protein
MTMCMANLDCPPDYMSASVSRLSRVFMDDEINYRRRNQSASVSRLSRVFMDDEINYGRRNKSARQL